MMGGAIGRGRCRARSGGHAKAGERKRGACRGGAGLPTVNRWELTLAAIAVEGASGGGGPARQSGGGRRGLRAEAVGRAGQFGGGPDGLGFGARQVDRLPADAVDDRPGWRPR